MFVKQSSKTMQTTDWQQQLADLYGLIIRRHVLIKVIIKLLKFKIPMSKARKTDK